MAQAKEQAVHGGARTAEGQLTAENTADSPIVQGLKAQVANAFLLYLNYKHYHWQTFGPHFRDLHRLFDEFAEEVLAGIDPLAERIRMIGQDPPARPNELADLASVSIAAPHSNMREMVEEGRQNLIGVIKQMREAAKTADDRNDPGTVDILSKTVQVYEKHEWWLRDILKKDDGLKD
ncbi:MAG: DNA starvation/stationary phase protection protein [Acidobacteria bacterium]|mgnify:CR=1 FL=1|nr:DNA starvation/stationary phase protection protein [Acidobacteriota bacterium]